MPDGAKDADRLEKGKDTDKLPKVGEINSLSELTAKGYTIEYASNRPDIVKVGDETNPGVFTSGSIVMKRLGVATITVKVTAPSGESATTDFIVYVQDDAGLSDITVGGVSIPNFNGNTIRYGCVVSSDTPADDASLAVKAAFDGEKTVTYSTTDDGSGTMGYSPDSSGNGVMR